MTPSRWQEIERTYNAVLQRPPEERAAFLSEVGKYDPELKREVESLLAQNSSKSAIIDRPAWAYASELTSTAVTETLNPQIQMGSDEGPPSTSGVLIEQPTTRSWFLWFAVAISGLVFGCYAFGAWLIMGYSGVPKPFGWDAGLRNHQWIVGGIDPSGSAAGRLRNGDRLLAFNQDRRAEQIGPELFMYFVPPGSPYTVRVWRSALEPDSTVALQLPNQSSSAFKVSSAVKLIPGLIELLMGLFMVLLRPDYRVARLGFAAFLVLSVRILYLTLDPFRGAGLGASTFLIPGLGWVSQNWFFGLAYHFVLRFFANVLKERLWWLLALLAYGICALFSVVNGVWVTLLFCGFTTATALVQKIPCY